MTSKTDDVREAVAAALGKRRGHPDPWASDYYDADAALEVIALISPAPAGVADYARAVMDAAPTIKGGWDTAYKIADRLAALSAPETAPVALDEGAAGEAVAWERLRTVGTNIGWVPVDPEDIPHYKSVGQEIRPLYTHPSTPSAAQDDRLRIGPDLIERLRGWPHHAQGADYSVSSIQALMTEAAEALAALNPETAK